jgi:hypothetical protein
MAAASDGQGQAARLIPRRSVPFLGLCQSAASIVTCSALRVRKETIEAEIRLAVAFFLSAYRVLKTCWL